MRRSKSVAGIENQFDAARDADPDFESAFRGGFRRGPAFDRALGVAMIAGVPTEVDGLALLKCIKVGIGHFNPQGAVLVGEEVREDLAVVGGLERRSTPGERRHGQRDRTDVDRGPSGLQGHAQGVRMRRGVRGLRAPRGSPRHRQEEEAEKAQAVHGFMVEVSPPRANGNPPRPSEPSARHRRRSEPARRAGVIVEESDTSPRRGRPAFALRHSLGPGLLRLYCHGKASTGDLGGTVLRRPRRTHAPFQRERVV